MDAADKTKVVCPRCRARYLVRPSWLQGERRCRKCGLRIPLAEQETRIVSPGARPESAPKPGPASPGLPSLKSFQILSELGRGSMGVVYKAQNLRLRRTVALKILPPSLTQAGPGRVERFLREACAAAQLDHPHIVGVYHAGQENGVCYIEQQYVEGQSLAQILRARGKLDALEATKIIRTAAEALRAAHKKGIVHRDVKPENLMIDTTGTVKVTDFGLARLPGSESPITPNGQILGSPQYMSPQQAEGRPTDWRTDQFSLGATYYHMVTGQPPFLGKQLIEVLRALKHKAPVAPRQVEPRLPEEMEQIILKMLQKDPAKRYPSMDALIIDLARASKTPLLLVVQLLATGQCVEYPVLDEPLSIGREEGNALVVRDATVSSRHATIVQKAGVYLIRDLGSRNGTLVNGERIREKALQAGDVIAAGASLLVLVEASACPDKETSSTLSAARFRLVSARGGVSEPTLPVGVKPMLLGRSPLCDLRLQGPEVSPFHAQLAPTPWGVALFDLHSKRGTTVNGKRVLVRLLQPGDRVRIADAEWRFEEMVGPPGEPRPRPSAPRQPLIQPVGPSTSETTATSRVPRQRQAPIGPCDTTGLVRALKEEAARIDAELGTSGRGPRTVALTVLGPHGERKTCRIGSEPIIIGSDKSCAIQLWGPNILPRHLTLRLDGPDILVEPLPGATACVRGKLIARKTTLKVGEMIVVGSNRVFTHV